MPILFSLNVTKILFSLNNSYVIYSSYNQLEQDDRHYDRFTKIYFSGKIFRLYVSACCIRPIRHVWLLEHLLADSTPPK